MRNKNKNLNAKSKVDFFVISNKNDIENFNLFQIVVIKKTNLYFKVNLN